MTTQRSCLVLAAALLVTCCFSLLSQSMAQPHGTARDQMELAQRKRLEAEADRLGMTADQLRTFDTTSLGTPLLYDQTRKVTVAWQENPDHSARTIRITPDEVGPEAVAVDYRLGTDKSPGAFAYAGKDSASGRAAIWKDLNADGIFDVLVIPTKRNDVLNLDQGTYILLDGKWTAATPTAKGSDQVMKVTDAMYYFDPASGRWQRK